MEVWWKTSDNTNRSNFFLRSGNNNVCRTYSWETGQWRYYDGGVPTDVLAIVNNRWYHHKYVFDCATDTWDWYIDGVQYGAGIAFDAVQDTLDNVIIQSRDGHSNYINYFDAIGFSWDPAYTVGDNEGYKIRRQSASAQITPVVGHLEVWRDPDDNKTYLIYTDEDEGIRKVEMT